MEMTKKSVRARTAPSKPWESKPTKFYLFFIRKENKYVHISPVSKWWPKDLKGENLTKGDLVTLGSGDKQFDAEFITSSDSFRKIEEKAKKLQRRLNSNRLLDDTNFSFLNSSTNSAVLPSQRDDKNETDYDIDHESDTSDDSDSNSSLKSSSCSDQSLLRGNFAGKTLKTQKPSLIRSIPRTSFDSSVQVCRLLRETNRILTKQTQEIRRLRQSILRSHAHPDISSDFDKCDPVIFKDIDITKMGRKNLDHTQYAIYLIRKLFTDEELVGKSIFPKRVTSKPPLSPRRSQAVSDAIKSRFQFDFESPQLQECFNSINQLTADVSRGKRLNKRANLI